MSRSRLDRNPLPTNAHWFATTHWSVVVAASDQNSPKKVDALEKLCRAYWYPLYAFIRREGYHPQDAQDLTQGFSTGHKTQPCRQRHTRHEIGCGPVPARSAPNVV